MSEQFLGEIKLLSFVFPPKGWALCNGQLLPIAQNQALFSLLGTTYGGDGRVTFALPNLQGRVPVAAGQGPGLDNYTQGQTGGETAHTLSLNEWVNHSHTLNGTRADGNSPVPTGKLSAVGTEAYSQGGPDTAMSPSTIAASNPGSQPHENRQPFLTLNFVIALQGIFPSRS
jgi:microcystin-dependent protein